MNSKDCPLKASTLLKSSSGSDGLWHASWHNGRMPHAQAKVHIWSRAILCLACSCCHSFSLKICYGMQCMFQESKSRSWLACNQVQCLCVGVMRWLHVIKINFGCILAVTDR